MLSHRRANQSLGTDELTRASLGTDVLTRANLGTDVLTRANLGATYWSACINPKGNMALLSDSISIIVGGSLRTSDVSVSVCVLLPNSDSTINTQKSYWAAFEEVILRDLYLTFGTEITTSELPSL